MTHNHTPAIDHRRFRNFPATERATTVHLVEVDATLTYESPSSDGTVEATEARATRLWMEPRDLRVMRALGPSATVHVLTPTPHAARLLAIEGDRTTSCRPLTPATITIDLHAAETGREIVPGWGLRHRRPIVVGCQVME